MSLSAQIILELVVEEPALIAKGRNEPKHPIVGAGSQAKIVLMDAADRTMRMILAEKFLVDFCRIDFVVQSLGIARRKFDSREQRHVDRMFHSDALDEV